MYWSIVSVTRGRVDVGPAGFVARFDFDREIVEQIKTIQRRRYLKEEKVWVVEPHWPSVRRLLHIASGLGWRISSAARELEQRVRAESEELEVSISMIHNGFGEAVFQCKVGDDDELSARIQSLPGVYWEDAWCVPTDWEQCCVPLLEIVQSYPKLQDSLAPAAQRLLTEEDVSHLHVRSSPPRAAAIHAIRPPPAARSPSRPWVANAHDLHMQALSRATTAEGFSVSAALSAKLLPFQLAGVRYLLTAQRALLADEMGLGKTIQALAALETVSAYPALIVCPANLRHNWELEARRFLPAARSVAVWRTAATQGQTDVLIASYGQLTQHQPLFAAQHFASIVADESHHIRNHTAKRSKAACAVAAHIPGLRICLSGTPLPNQPVELARQLEFLGVLTPHFGGFWRFAERYCAPQSTEYGTVFGADNLEELGQRLRARCYCRREKSVVLPQLPPKTRRIVEVSFDDREASHEGLGDSRLET